MWSSLLVLIALNGAVASTLAEVGGDVGGGRSVSNRTRRLLATDYIGKDPRGADVRGWDVVGSDPIGQDTIGGGRGRKQVKAPASEERAPPATEAPLGKCTTAAQLLASNPNTTILEQLVKAAGLTGYLSDPSKVFTLFAPDNISWQSFFQGFNLTAEKLAADKQLLQAILQYHIVPDQAQSFTQAPHPCSFGTCGGGTQKSDGLQLPTLADGQTLGVRLPTPSNPYFFLVGAQGYLLGAILQADLPACSSLVDYIGSVMVSNAVDQLLTARGLVGR